MEIWPYIVPFAWIVLLEALTVRWIAANPVPGLVSRIFASNLAGIALAILISLTGWFFGWWPEIRNWALRDSFFLVLLAKAPFFGYLFRRWGMQRIFTLHVLSNFISVTVISLLFVYSPLALAIQPRGVDYFNKAAIRNILEIRDAVERYKGAHGYYPRYLWGGDELSWGISKIPRDPLLAEGYLDMYPVNPLSLRRTFFEPRRVPGWKELWFGYKSDEFLNLRSLWLPIVESDPRFGYRGAKMGNVLPDPTMPETRLPENIRFTRLDRWLPGGFFYRSYDLNADGKRDAYIMGVCGDEFAEATVDCYDARLDTLTTVVEGGHVIPSAHDRKRDGVIYLIRQGFPEYRSPLFGQEIPRVPVLIDPVTGEPIPQEIPFGDSLSAGNTEPDVTPEESGDVENSAGDGESGGENVENESFNGE